MICADFLAGASLENEDPSLLLQSMSRFFKFLPGDQRQAFLHEVTENASSTEFRPSAPVCGWIPKPYEPRIVTTSWLCFAAAGLNC